MKKFLISLTLFFLIFCSVNYSFSYCSTSNISYLQSQISRIQSQISNYSYMGNGGQAGVSSAYQQEISNLHQQLDDLESQLAVAQSDYNECLNNENMQNKYREYYNKGYQLYNSQNDLVGAVEYWEMAYNYCTESCSNIEELLVMAYDALGGLYAEKEDFDKAISYYKKALSIAPKNFIALLDLGTLHILVDQDVALSYFEKAKDAAMTSDEINLVNEKIEITKKIKEDFKRIEEEKEAQKNSATNDTYNYKQYYLENMDVYEAWEKIGNNGKKVIIAVIDDGININHPDLTSSIYTNKNEIPGNGIDDDNNGYIDDYNGWNFVSNSNNMTPAGNHGTMVAGIIGAKTNNSEGIAGIIPNGKISLMSLIVFANNGYANSDAVIKAIDYAIDNGANIINLSLGGEQFQYSNKYDNVLKKAYNKGVVVVIAAGNGDTLTNGSVGVNTSISKLSPVCNTTQGPFQIIGVGALNKNGKVASRSNYGGCVDIYAYGEGIYTTTISSSDPYTSGTGTSFSAPIISAIVGLGYNKYGQINPETVYNALFNSKNGNIVNASKYLDNLQTSIGELSDSIQWMYSKNLTIFTDPVSFMYNNGLRRDEASKFFVRYAEDILGMAPDYSKTDCKFKDLNKAWPDLKDIVVEACQLGLFQGYKGNFMPTDKLTNAQAITVFIRLLDGYKDESGDHFANEYYTIARESGLLKGLNLENRAYFDRETTRGEVAIMLYRGQNTGE